MIVATFYKFIELDQLETLQSKLKTFCENNGIMGTILLAEEGINSTIAGDKDSIEQFFKLLKEDEQIADIQPKLTETEELPFLRLKVKIKPEIVTMGVDEIQPAMTTGEHIDPKTWNEIISDPEVLVIDTRNEYEYKVGTFQNAISPHTDSFRQFPEFVEENLDPKKHKKIAMFCTGGIRCEKASAYLVEKGFEEVYQLNGGILNYLETVSSEESLWEGECFVFDQRVAVTEDLETGNYELCYACSQPLSPADRQSEKYEPGISCPYCYDHLTEKQRDRCMERRRQQELAKQRNQKHIGANLSKG